MADINPDESIAEALEGANPGLVTPQTQPSSTEELQRRSGTNGAGFAPDAGGNPRKVKAGRAAA